MKIALIGLLLTLTLASAVQQLQMVIQISRHGARASISPDPWYDWDHYGELTSNGIRAEYVLGKEALNRYSSLIPSIYDPTLIKIRSTAYNRTLQSVNSQLYGIFTVGNEQNAPQLPSGYNVSLSYPPLQSQVQYTDFWI